MHSPQAIVTNSDERCGTARNTRKAYGKGRELKRHAKYRSPRNNALEDRRSWQDTRSADYTIAGYCGVQRESDGDTNGHGDSCNTPEHRLFYLLNRTPAPGSIINHSRCLLGALSAICETHGRKQLLATSGRKPRASVRLVKHPHAVEFDFVGPAIEFLGVEHPRRKRRRAGHQTCEAQGLAWRPRLSSRSSETMSFVPHCGVAYFLRPLHLRQECTKDQLPSA